MLLVLATAIAVPGRSSVRVVLVLDLSFIALHFGLGWISLVCMHCLRVLQVLRLVHERWRRLVHLVDCMMDVGMRDVDHVMN